VAEAGERSREADATFQTSFGMLSALLRRLGQVPGEKILVIMSAGMNVADRPGARLNVDTLSADAGKAAAAGDVTVYGIFLDQSLLNAGLAENHSGVVGSLSGEDSQTLSHWLDVVAGAAGGTLITDLVGDGEIGFDRVIRETSAYYALGVVPDAKDHDGRPHPITVKVDRHGVTVRSRKWALIPKDAGAAPAH
jgi:VWFA-related protein